MSKDTIWDVIVVGGGPAGMMAAGRASELGQRVLLVEKNASLGKKLLITGGGRCNVTNSEFDNRKFLSKFKENDKFLFSAFSQFSVKEALDFFHTRKMETKVENELRTFPLSNTAESVHNVLLEYLKETKVEILLNSKVEEIMSKDDMVTGIKLGTGKIIQGRSVVLATGGTSRPETGSTGDAYPWLKTLGHTVVEPTPSLVPLSVKDKWAKSIPGITLSDIKITVLQAEVKQVQTRGKLLFTHVGVSGPTILNMSRDIGELLKYGQVFLSIDLLPDEDYSTLNTKLQEIFKEHDKKKVVNALSTLIPSALSPLILEFSDVDLNTPCNSVTRVGRLSLVKNIKNLRIQVDSLLGLDKAVIASGGVVLDEVDFKTMRSRLYPNLYLVGDVLNIDRPSGGYSLQLCWTTGFVAGSSISV